MIFSFWRRPVLLSPLLVCLIALLASLPAYSQTNYEDFNREFAAVSQKLQIPFIVEEGLFPARCNPEVTLPVDATDTKMLATLAARWDFDVERRPGVILFRKRYSRNDDLPFVSLAEWAAAMRDIQVVLTDFDPADPPVHEIGVEPWIGDLAKSLSPEQRGPLKNGVAVSTLTPEQQRLVWHFGLKSFGGNQINEANNSEYLANKILNKNRYFLLSEGDVAPLESRSRRNAESISRHPSRVPFHPITLPEGEGRVKLADIKISDKGLIRVPLSKAVRQWGDKISLDEPIGTNIISIFREKLLTPQRFVATVARLYGYRHKAEEGEKWRISRLNVRKTADIKQVVPLGSAALPLTLRRYFCLDRKPKYMDTMEKILFDEVSQGPDAFSNALIYAGLTQSKGEGRFIECFRRRNQLFMKFAVSLMTECLKAKQAKKPVSLLVEDALSAAILIPDAIEGLERIFHDNTPAYLSDFPNATIVVKPTEQAGFFEVHLKHSVLIKEINMNKGAAIMMETKLPSGNPK
jgi:hypothetical protein